MQLACVIYFYVFLTLAMIFIFANSSFISHLQSLYYFQEAGGAYVKAKPTSVGPNVKDPNLKVEIVFKNNGKLDTPSTSMSFLGPNDILVLEKNEGTVRRITGGQLQPDPVR